MGHYHVSPLCKRLDDGRYAASVSIRNGRGSATTDRVMRFAGSFGSAAEARHYAHEQGLLWVLQAGSPALRRADRAAPDAPTSSNS